jgi:hypothetical protein
MFIAPAEEYPKLRLLDIRPYAHNGQSYLLLRDPYKLSDKLLFVPQPLAPLLAFCDGTRSAKGVATAFSLTYGLPIAANLVERLVAALDEACLLDNARSLEAWRRALEAYRQAPFRRPALAGQGYPAHADALHNLLESFLERASCPNGDESTAEPLTSPSFSRIGLLSPHIDYSRGGLVYAQTWKHAAQAVKEAELMILFGTDHYGDDPLTLTRQNYATPYGVLPTAQEVVEALVDVIGEEAAFAGELRHRREHSLELVAVWLHHIRQRRPCAVVPILCGSFHRFIQNGSTPADDPLLNRALGALRQATADRRVVVVASGDMAHVGPAFGGAPLDPMQRARMRAADDDLIAHMCAGDAEGFFASIKAVNDGNNVCGVSPIYLTMRLLGNVTGEKVGYATCPADEHNTSAVTVSGVVFRTER